MDYLLPTALVVHIAATFYWAGTTMAQGRIGNDHALELFPSQTGAAILAIIAGAILWQGFHSAGFGAAELDLTIGIVAALIVFVWQILAFRALRRDDAPGGVASLRSRKAIAALAGLAILTMALSRIL